VATPIRQVNLGYCFDERTELLAKPIIVLGEDVVVQQGCTKRYGICCEALCLKPIKNLLQSVDACLQGGEKKASMSQFDLILQPQQHVLQENNTATHAASGAVVAAKQDRRAMHMKAITCGCQGPKA
jgi:hypothetical protein